MRKGETLKALLPPLELSQHERTMLLNLTDTLTAHNVAQSNTLVVTKDGQADARAWRELRRKDGLRVYKERPAAETVTGAPALPHTPSLLLLGSTPGSLDDVMYSLVAPTAQDMKLKSSCVHDGVVDSKVLCELARPSLDQPFRHVGVKWSLYSLSEPRDYVCIESTGVLRGSVGGHARPHGSGERIGFYLAHSVAFPNVPSFCESHDVERGHRSVCWLFREKKDAKEVEVYARGFFEFDRIGGGGASAMIHRRSYVNGHRHVPGNELLINIAMQAIANQWLSFSRQMESAQMKKLVWRLRRNSSDVEDFGFTELQPAVLGELSVGSSVSVRVRETKSHSNGSLSSGSGSGSESGSSSSEGVTGASSKSSEPLCCVCRKSFRLLDRKTTCKSCTLPVCPRCRVKRRVCVLAPDQRTLLEKRRTFCTPCISEVTTHNAREIVMEELMKDHVDDDGIVMMPLERQLTV